MTVHNFITQYNTVHNSSDNLPSYLQTTIIAVFRVVSRR